MVSLPGPLSPVCLAIRLVRLLLLPKASFDLGLAAHLFSTRFNGTGGNTVIQLPG